MNNLYVRLAAQNIKKHRRSYVPFMLAGVFVAAVSYILNSLSNNTELGPTSQMMFTLGSTVVMLFAVIFLFYTNSFLMKQRKKELGLYNVLGMNKRPHCPRHRAGNAFHGAYRYCRRLRRRHFA